MSVRARVGNSGLFKNKSLSYLFFFLTALVLSVVFNNCSAPMNSQSALTESSSTSQASSVTYSGNRAAEILLISNSGSVWGYARDTSNSSLILNVRFYVDGPAGNGRFAGETWANQRSSGPNAGHFFTFQLPAEFVNGVTHTLYMYVVEDRAANLLPTMSFAGYTPKAESVFNNQIEGFVQVNCTRCHQTYWNYTTLFSGPLLKPTPAAGGTATNNLLINRMVGTVSHSGGKFCPNGLSDPLCVELQRWWNAEFK
jgi:hypothetical protein